MSMLRYILLIASVTGCSSKSDTATTDTATDTGEHIEHTAPDRCTPELRVEGTPATELADPTVGDSWYVLMYCDGTLQVGAYTLRVEPTELATVDGDEPIVTFAAAGTAEIQYRMGSHQVALPVTILE